MIDRHYGYLARDSRQHAVALLDALAFERAVDATWTSTRTHEKRATKAYLMRRSRRSGRLMDVAWTPHLVSVAATDDKEG